MKRVGVIGGGQLAAMMAEPAQALGVKLVVQTPSLNDPAVAFAKRARSAFAADTIIAPVDDAAATAELANRCDVITFENEFVNLEALLPLAAQGVCFRPGLQVLSAILDKYHQRCYLKQLGLPQPKFVALEEMGRWGDREITTGQGDKGTRGQGECPSPPSPHPPIPPSPYLPISIWFPSGAESSSPRL